jgi:hypothetical protein
LARPADGRLLRPADREHADVVGLRPGGERSDQLLAQFAEGIGGRPCGQPRPDLRDAVGKVIAPAFDQPVRG